MSVSPIAERFALSAQQPLLLSPVLPDATLLALLAATTLALAILLTPWIRQRERDALLDRHA